MELAIVTAGEMTDLITPELQSEGANNAQEGVSGA